jgi:hypothetical protein
MSDGPTETSPHPIGIRGIILVLRYVAHAYNRYSTKKSHDQQLSDPGAPHTRKGAIADLQSSL